LNDEQPDDLEAIGKSLLRTTASGALATLHESGAPFASFVNVATTMAGEPILLLSSLAVHTSNVKHDARVSLLLVEKRANYSDPVATGRLTLSGKIHGPETYETLRRRYLARHRDAAGYAGFTDFGFYRIEVERAYLVAGFGRITPLTRQQVLTDLSESEDLTAAEANLLAWLNGSQLATIASYFAPNGGDDGTEWRATGIDPEGVDVIGPLDATGGAPRRIAFTHTIKNGEEARTALAALFASRP
jgi:putative heme iron utilization protein